MTHGVTRRSPGWGRLTHRVTRSHPVSKHPLRQPCSWDLLRFTLVHIADGGAVNSPGDSESPGEKAPSSPAMQVGPSSIHPWCISPRAARLTHRVTPSHPVRRHPLRQVGQVGSPSIHPWCVSPRAARLAHRVTRSHPVSRRPFRQVGQVGFPLTYPSLVNIADGGAVDSRVD